MFRVLAKWQNTGAKMAEFCGFLDDRKVPDESHLTNKINGIDADVSGSWPDARLCVSAFATQPRAGVTVELMDE
jgi:hypothetical protein